MARAIELQNMFRGYRIRDLRIEPGLVLSPMSGVTTSAFRRLIREFNPGAVGLVVTEFVSVEGMTRLVPRTLQMMRFVESERPVGIQIFGYDIQRMRDAARMVEDHGADLVDINCGCPAPKVVRRGGGCELMRQPEHLAQIFRAVRSAVKIPLTMKMRSGWDDDSLNAAEIAQIAESEGIEAIAIHGRTRRQLYRGEADWTVAEAVADLVKVPVLGSGDVVGRASAELRLRGRLAGLFIGRGALSNPLVFSEIVSGQAASLRTNPELVIRILDRYIELLREEFSERACIGKIKQLVSQVARGFDWRKMLLQAETFKDQMAGLSQIKSRGLVGHVPDSEAVAVS